ncbi:MAG: NADH-quinone oxidoreductase subunit A [Pseudomonadota bacterium]
MMDSYIPVLILLVIVGVIGVALLILPGALAPKVHSDEKMTPYECGWEQTTTPRIRSSVKFYRIALLFLVFDIEAAFFYPWAVLFRDLSCKGSMQNGICHGGATAFGLLVMAVFLAILALALVFVWRRKALEWD